MANITLRVWNDTPFRVDASAVIIGSSTAGYTLYHGPSVDDLQPYKDSEGNDVQVGANHPLTVMCAVGTWFKLSGNTGEVKINF